MFDLFPILLAAENSDATLAWVVGTIVTALTTGGGGRLLWGWWSNREREKRAAWQKVVDDKDVIIAAKDVRIQELSKELSKKSDAHAEKIQELMGLALDKVESMGTKVEGLLGRALAVQSDFTAEVRKLNLEPGSDIGGST